MIWKLYKWKLLPNCLTRTKTKYTLFILIKTEFVLADLIKEIYLNSPFHKNIPGEGSKLQKDRKKSINSKYVGKIKHKLTVWIAVIFFAINYVTSKIQRNVNMYQNGGKLS